MPASVCSTWTRTGRFKGAVRLPVATPCGLASFLIPFGLDPGLRLQPGILVLLDQDKHRGLAVTRKLVVVQAAAHQVESAKTWQMAGSSPWQWGPSNPILFLNRILWTEPL